MIGTATTTLLVGGALLLARLATGGVSVYLLGAARSALAWPSHRQPPVGRTLSVTLVGVGVVLAAAGVATMATVAPLGDRWRWPAAAGAAVLALAAGTVAAAKTADRAELHALIRAPSPLYHSTAGKPPSDVAVPRPEPATLGGNGTSPPEANPGPKSPGAAQPTDSVCDPAVPPGGQPGWVYRDAAGAWYLLVDAPGGGRLVRLADFQLVAPGTAQAPLELAGGVELSVWPLPEDLANSY